MQAIIIIVAVVLLLKFLATSHKAAAIAIETSCMSQSCGGSGDSFFGNTTVAGVCEPHPSMPPVTIHCCHIVAHFPVDPPPIAIQKPIPVSVATPKVTPPNPIINVYKPPTPKPPTTIAPKPISPIRPVSFLAQRPVPVSPYRMRVL